MNDPVIDISGVSFSYNDHPVLEDVDLKIQQGDFMAIIGPNGGGKTTLVKLILGIIEPLGGSVRVFGLPPVDACHRIGYVPQEYGMNKDFPICVRDVVVMGRLKRGTRGYSSADRKLAREALEKVEMWEFRNRRIGELSGGQLQRVFIARALASVPDVLILDEPTSGVDMHGKTAFFELLKDLNSEVTIVVVSHDVMAISSYIKTVACVNRNVIVHEGDQVTPEMIDMSYSCPVDLIAHGLPHRVFHEHED